jgi:hypothetical protein
LRGGGRRKDEEGRRWEESWEERSAIVIKPSYAGVSFMIDLLLYDCSKIRAWGIFTG